MDPLDADQLAMLEQARAKARHLLEALLEQQRRIEAEAPEWPPELRTAGQAAFGQAIESARQAAKAIDEAVE